MLHCPSVALLKPLLVNRLMGTLQPHSNRPLYSSTVIGTMAVDGCYIWYSKEGPGPAAAPSSPLLAVPNVAAHPSTASVSTSYYSKSITHIKPTWFRLTFNQLGLERRLVVLVKLTD